MTDRDELINAGMQAMSSSLSPRAKQVWVTRILDAVEPLIRTDERLQMLGEFIADDVVQARARERADLRARVDVLEPFVTTGPDEEWVLKAEVLALFGGDT